ncbi:Alpha/beta hydrolase fold-1 [Dendryphion nanum]|uniref:Alpha/beta hydrolase fold-1 n=1 Tax=Dendryphion nanum TaxID=256645 RepID=A0A9P9IFY6_9PLEO|nr:Alpha/beta hydrolase fold-1 [Dendryphion nanum]
MTKPQIVLIPGAWHTSEAFGTIITKLEGHGYTIHTRQMPAVGNTTPPKDLTEDIEAIRELVTKAIGNGEDVLAVPHSWAGIPASSALVGYGKKQREEKGDKGGVTRLAFLCAFVVPEGVSLFNACQDQIPPWYHVEGDHSIVDDGSVFYNDLPAEEQKHWISKLQSHSFATTTAGATGAAWKDIPTSYLLTEDDQAIPAFAQELMTNGVKDMGGDIQVERIKSGHSPFLSKPDAVVDYIRRAAGETI